MENPNDILLAKWLEGQATVDEIKTLQKTYDLKLLSEILNAQNQFTTTTISESEMWKQFQVKKTKKLYWKFLIYGLLFLIFLSTLGFYLFKTSKTGDIKLNTPKTVRQDIALEDGSLIKLSPRSYIKYNEKEWTNKRELFLDGQATFSISKGIPFEITTKAGKVKVLGTVFDVWSIDPEYMTVRCTEGSVLVSDGTNSEKINGGEQISINKGAILEIEKNNMTIPDWTNATREYESIPIHIVFSDLGRFYEEDFILSNIDNDALFSGIIPIDDINETLRYLSTITNYDYTKSDHQYVFK